MDDVIQCHRCQGTYKPRHFQSCPHCGVQAIQQKAQQAIQSFYFPDSIELKKNPCEHCGGARKWDEKRKFLLPCFYCSIREAVKVFKERSNDVLRQTRNEEVQLKVIRKLLLLHGIFAFEVARGEDGA